MIKKLLLVLSIALSLGACQMLRPVEEEKKEEYSVLEEEDVKKKNKEAEKEIKEIKVPDRVHFGFDKYNLTKEARKILDLQVEWLKQDSHIKIILEGHCDERGTREYNLALGQRRADTVKNYLVDHGVSKRRIKTISYGKERPEFLGKGEAIWKKNRRTVVVVND